MLQDRLEQQAKTESDPLVFAKQTEAMQALAAKLAPEVAQSLFQDLLAKMENASISGALDHMARAVPILAINLKPQTAQALIQGLLERITPPKLTFIAARERRDPFAPLVSTAHYLAVQTEVVQTLATKLKPQVAQILFQDLLTRMKHEQDPSLLAALVKMALAMENQSTIDTQPDSPVQLQPYVDLLKGYVGGGFVQSRKAILNIIEVKTGQKFDGDKWRFVEWATSKDAAKFHLNLD